LKGIGPPGPHDQAIIGLSGDGEGAFVLPPGHYRPIAGWKVALKRPNARVSFFSWVPGPFFFRRKGAKAGYAGFLGGAPAESYAALYHFEVKAFLM
jgi:hypothetical protein